MIFMRTLFVLMSHQFGTDLSELVTSLLFQMLDTSVPNVRQVSIESIILVHEYSIVGLSQVSCNW